MLVLPSGFDDVHVRGWTWTTRLMNLGDVVFASGASKLDRLSNAFVPPFVSTEGPTDS